MNPKLEVGDILFLNLTEPQSLFAYIILDITGPIIYVVNLNSISCKPRAFDKTEVKNQIQQDKAFHFKPTKKYSIGNLL